jgi:hypothetical protein
MALFENMFGSRAEFRPAGRLEKSDPLARKAYEAEKKTWEAERKAANEERKAYEKEMEKRYGKNWLNIVQSQKRAQQRSTRKAEVEKAAEDMRSGKTSSFVGKAGRDPYAGVEGPLPMYRTPEEAEAAGQARYISPEQEQYMPAQAYVGKSEQERAAMETSGEYPEVGRFKPTEGRGVEVRRAIPQQRVFKAMIEGKPEESQVFETEAEAKAFIKEKGGKGAVASVRGTPEEMARYKEESLSGMREEARLKDLYQQRRSQASARAEKLQTAMRDYDEAESPELKATAGQRIEEARREIDVAQKTRGMQPEQRKKFEAGLADIVQKRKEREEVTARRTATAREQRQAQLDVADIKRSGQELEKEYNRIMLPLYRASREAARKGNFAMQYEIENVIAENTAGVPRDPTQRRAYFESGAGEEWKNRLIQRAEAQAAYEARERSKSNTNPTIYR